MKEEEYERFRWFFTSSGKIAIGGKSAEQNEAIIKGHLGKQDVVAHTELPSSPFVIIKAERKPISEQDIKEAAIFCASFSRQWKMGKRKVEMHIFKPEQIAKERGSKTGTFSVRGRVRKIRVELKLALAIQNKRLRAVPLSAAKECLAVIQPGNLEKEKAAGEIERILTTKGLGIEKEEIMQALPSGGFHITPC